MKVAQQHRAGVIAWVASGAAISSSAVLGKLALERGADAGGLVVFRHALPAVLALAVLVLLRRSALSHGWRPLVAPVAAGASFWVVSRTEFLGVERLPATILVLLLVLAPVWIMIIQRIVWGERPRPAQWLAVVLVVAGVAVMAGPVGGDVTLLGILFGLLASLFTAGYLLLIERGGSSLPLADRMTVMAVVAGVLALAAAPTAIPEGLGTDAAPYLMLLGVVAVLWVAFLIPALGNSDAWSSTIAVGTEPLFAGVLAFIVLNETLAARQYAAAVVLILGVLVAAAPPRRTREAVT